MNVATRRKISLITTFIFLIQIFSPVIGVLNAVSATAPASYPEAQTETSVPATTTESTSSSNEGTQTSTSSSTESTTSSTISESERSEASTTTSAEQSQAPDSYPTAETSTSSTASATSSRAQGSTSTATSETATSTSTSESTTTSAGSVAGGNINLTNNSIAVDPVELNRTYTLPSNDLVTIKFTELPQNPGNLEIVQVSLQDSSPAYKFETSMQNGTFKYEMTLPRNGVENPVVKYADSASKVSNNQALVANAEVIGEDYVTYRGDHFTVFVVTNDTPASSSALCVSDATTTGDCYNSLQAAISAAVNGDEILIENGTYNLTSTVNVNKEVTIRGESRSGVLIDGNAVSGYGMLVTADNVTIRDLRLDGPNGGSSYGLKIQNNDNVNLTNIEVFDSYRSNIDFNGSDNITISNVTATGASSGVGIALTDSVGANLSNITTTGNAWAGIAFYTSVYFPPAGTSDVTLTGTNSISEDLPVYEDGTPVTNIDVMADFPFILQTTDNTDFAGYFASYADADQFATNGGFNPLTTYIVNTTTNEVTFPSTEFVYAERYVRENNGGDMAAQVHVGQIVNDVRFFLNGNGPEAGSYINDVNSELERWRLLTPISGGEYTVTAQVEIAGEWYDMAGNSTVYSIDAPDFEYRLPNPNRNFFRAVDNPITVQIDDEFNQFESVTFEVFEYDGTTRGTSLGEFTVERADCDLSSAGNFVRCDIDESSSWSNLAEGEYIADAKSDTLANNGMRYHLSGSDSMAFFVDETNPTLDSLEIVNSTPTDIYSGEIEVRATASDAAPGEIRRVNLELKEANPDGTCSRSLPTIDSFMDETEESGYYSTSFDTSGLNGDYCLFAIATDLAYNNGGYGFEGIPVTVDNIAPEVTINTPMDGEVVSGNLVTEVTATDNIGMGSYYIRYWEDAPYVSNGGTKISECFAAPGATNLGTNLTETCELDTTTLTDGTYFVTAQFLDGASQWGSDVHSFVVDNTAPFIEDVQMLVNGVEQDYVTAGDDVEIRVTVTEANGISETQDSRFWMSNYANNWAAGEQNIESGALECVETATETYECSYTFTMPAEYTNGDGPITQDRDGQYFNGRIFDSVGNQQWFSAERFTYYEIATPELSFEVNNQGTTETLQCGDTFYAPASGNEHLNPYRVYGGNSGEFINIYAEWTDTALSYQANFVRADGATWSTVKEDPNSFHGYPLGRGHGTESFEVIAFFDVNQNGSLDEGEPTAEAANCSLEFADNIGPVVEIINPEAGDVVSGDMDLIGSIFDDNLFRFDYKIFDVDGNTIVDGPTDGSSPYDQSSFENETLFTWDSSTVEDGEYTVMLNARDEFGNKDPESRVDVNITVDNYYEFGLQALECFNAYSTGNETFMINGTEYTNAELRAEYTQFGDEFCTIGEGYTFDITYDNGTNAGGGAPVNPVDLPENPYVTDANGEINLDNLSKEGRYEVRVTEDQTDQLVALACERGGIGINNIANVGEYVLPLDDSDEDGIYGECVAIFSSMAQVTLSKEVITEAGDTEVTTSDEFEVVLTNTATEMSYAAMVADNGDNENVVLTVPTGTYSVSEIMPEETVLEYQMDTCNVVIGEAVANPETFTVTGDELVLAECVNVLIETPDVEITDTAIEVQTDESFSLSADVLDAGTESANLGWVCTNSSDDIIVTSTTENVMDSDVVEFNVTNGFDPAGTYTCTATITDAEGDEDSDSITITVTEPEVPPSDDNVLAVALFGLSPASNNGAGTVTVAANANFTMVANLFNDADPNYTYVFDGVCDGTTTTSATSFTDVLNLAAGSYTCGVTVTDTDGDTASTSVTINAVTNTGGVGDSGDVLGESDETESTEEEQQEEQSENQEVEPQQCNEFAVLDGRVYTDVNNNNVYEMDIDEAQSGVEVLVYGFDEDGDRILVTSVFTEIDGTWDTELCVGNYEVEIDNSVVPANTQVLGASSQQVNLTESGANADFIFNLIDQATQENNNTGILLIGLIIALLLLAAGTYYYSKQEQGGI